jgi:hypothetical protein
MVMVQTRTFPNESPPPEAEGWILVRPLRLRTVYMRRIVGTPRPNLMGETPETKAKINRFQTDRDAEQYKNAVSTVDESSLVEILAGLIL